MLTARAHSRPVNNARGISLKPIALQRQAFDGNSKSTAIVFRARVILRDPATINAVGSYHLSRVVINIKGDCYRILAEV
jgi:hypothetical protein